MTNKTSYQLLIENGFRVRRTWQAGKRVGKLWIEHRDNPEWYYQTYLENLDLIETVDQFGRRRLIQSIETWMELENG